jgi:hypothetical protein
MDISRWFLALGGLLAAFGAATYLILSTPALQWVGVDNFVWPAALTLLAISVIAVIVSLTPGAKRAIAASPYKRSFALGYFCVVFYAGAGILTLIIYPFRAASGI